MGDVFITVAMVMMALALGLFVISMILLCAGRKSGVWFLAFFLVCLGLFFVFLVVGGDINRANMESTAPSSSPSSSVDLSVEYADIYRAYKKNELAADDIYKGNRYRITGVIAGIESDGIFNATGGATLTMKVKVDNTIVYFLAEFEKEQEDALKKVAVGDTITFDGKCLDHGNWVDCEIVEEDEE